MADAAYKVLHRPHRHISVEKSYAVAPDGTRLEVRQNGPMRTYYPGDVIEDLSPGELEAFPDRFQPATQAEIEAYRDRQRQARQVLVAPGMSTEDAAESQRLADQIADLQRQQDALYLKASTPVPVDPQAGQEADMTPRPLQRGTGRSFSGQQGANIPTGGGPAPGIPAAAPPASGAQAPSTAESQPGTPPAPSPSAAASQPSPPPDPASSPAEESQPPGGRRRQP